MSKNITFEEEDKKTILEVPKYVMPEVVEYFIAKLEEKGIEVASDERNKITEELSNVKGFLDNLDNKETEIHDRIQKTISESSEIGPIVPEITKLKEKYDFLKDK